MQQVTVGTKYQIVIPKRIRMELKGIIPGRKVIVKKLDDSTISVQTPKKTSSKWSDENFGAFQKYWKGIDPIAEAERIRNEWDA